MISLSDVPFIVTDVETTGPDGETNRITEIACCVVQGGAIIERFSSLVNPHQFIPPFISKMTGISNSMAFGAPEADDVFENVLALLSMPNAVFVAHHVGFDWSFVYNTLVRHNFATPNMPLLCSCKLAKRLLPKDVKKNVGAVAEYFGITVENRHRAGGDAEATALFFLEFLRTIEQEHDVETIDELIAFQNKRISAFAPPPEYLKRIQPYLDQLPDEPGVYTMLDKDDAILYIGKAKSLKERVRSYFRHGAEHHTEKISQMVRKVHKIELECTATELAALLLESKKIKLHKPPFNSAGKKLRRYPFLRLDRNDDFPRLEWAAQPANDGAEYYGPFRNRTMTNELADTIQKNFQLRKCSEPLIPDLNATPCFYYHIGRCKAPCATLQSQEIYAIEVEKVRKFLSGCSSNNVVEQLTQEMNIAAEALDFEQAILLRNRISELQRLFARKENVSSSVTENNVVLILPVSEREKTVEIFVVCRGRLVRQEIVGRKSRLAELKKFLTTSYFNYIESNEETTLEDVDEIQIVVSWLHRHRHSGTYVYVEGKTQNEVLSEVETAVRNSFCNG